MALSAPNFPVFYRSIPISSTNFLKKMNFFYWLLTVPNFYISELFDVSSYWTSGLGLAVFSPSKLCEPLRLGLRCVETNSETG